MVDLPLLFRDENIKEAEKFVNLAQLSQKSRLLVLRGDSGVGKSRLAKLLLRRILEHHPNIFSVYIDLSEDDFFTAHLFECLCHICWSEFAPTPQTALPLSIPFGKNFAHFLKDSRVKSDLVRHLHASVSKTTADWLPFLGPLPYVPEAGAEGDDRRPVLPDLASMFFAYLQKISRSTACYIAFDNYQFLPRPLRLLFESRLASLRKNICLMIVDRTIEGKSDVPSVLCFSSDELAITLNAFNPLQVTRLISETLPRLRDSERVAQDCYLKTGGNLKEIEFYVQRIAAAADQNTSVKVFLDTIGSLPILERHLLSLVALFPAGLKLPYVNAIIQRLEESGSDTELEKVVGNLALLGYIVQNSRSGQMIRPAHEKVILAVRKTVSDHEILTLRQAVIETFESLLNRGLSAAEYAYILHCLVGVLTEKEYERSIDRVIGLIDLQYRGDKFHYVVSLYRNLPDQVVARLPLHIINALLDSFQKTSEFHLGMIAIERLRHLGRESASFDRALVKYLIQTYRYQDALEMLSHLVLDDELLLNQAMALQYMGSDTEARPLVEQARTATAMNRFKVILLRNSAHLYSYNDAIANLGRALEYFEGRSEIFEAATVRNNLGIVYLWEGELETARHFFLEARDTFAELASNEVYQPLINLGVTYLVEQQAEEGMLYLLEARQWVPNLLTLDQLILEANIMVAQLIQSAVSIQAAEESFARFYAEAKTIQDEKLHSHIGFNLAQLQRHRGGIAKVSVSKTFLEAIQCRHRTGFETFIDFPGNDSGSSSKLLLALSPHWRY